MKGSWEVMGNIMSGTIYGAYTLENGSRISFQSSAFDSVHFSHWYEERGSKVDELKDAEANNLKRWFEVPPPRASAYLAPMKVTDIGSPWKGRNRWNMKRIQEEWKAKGLI